MRRRPLANSGSASCRRSPASARRTGKTAPGAALTGASRAHVWRADVARATLEAIACQIADVFRAMERDLGAPLAMISVDGGATRNDLLMQWQADLLGRPVQRVKILELSAFGVGVLAGLARRLLRRDDD